MDIEEYQDLLKIDKHSLDMELVEQAEIYNQTAQEYANAVSVRDAAYQTMKETYSECYTIIRKEADEDGRKVTEAILDNEIKVNENYTNTVDEWLKAKEEADNMQALKDSFEQRSRMLTRLVDLYISGYFMHSGVSSSNNDSENYKYESNKAKIRNAKENK